MNIFMYFVTTLLILSAMLSIGVLFFGYIKYLKKNRYPNWKFPDYVSVGHAEYLYSRYVKRR